MRRITMKCSIADRHDLYLKGLFNSVNEHSAERSCLVTRRWISTPVMQATFNKMRKNHNVDADDV